ncbi:hypothetical protein R0131_11320 [Clostridium sp. AL.422]|uniref:hypothetical protein n=1 Tax=Clostridium TaxID=1485 RepID=UPI00293DCF7A|nr:MULTISPECIES: hypothetical protein [unclassified Clostridium]MDV4151432.1 hypothetical protein [Clostridium sp. AL.422]
MPFFIYVRKCFNRYFKFSYSNIRLATSEKRKRIYNIKISLENCWTVAINKKARKEAKKLFSNTGDFNFEAINNKIYEVRFANLF